MIKLESFLKNKRLKSCLLASVQNFLNYNTNWQRICMALDGKHWMIKRMEMFKTSVTSVTSVTRLHSDAGMTWFKLWFSTAAGIDRQLLPAINTGASILVCQQWHYLVSANQSWISRRLEPTARPFKIHVSYNSWDIGIICVLCIS